MDDDVKLASLVDRTNATVIGENITFFREVRGLSLEALAEKVECSRPTISKYEKGEIKRLRRKIDFLRRVAGALNVPVDELIARTTSEA